MHTDDLLHSLRKHDCHDEDEARHCAEIIAFTEGNRDCWWRRSTLAGHITASAWIVNSARTHALLLHHAKLDRWLQPGGHLDDSDGTPANGALRESNEETGLLSLTLASEKLFDVDVHAIPARAAEPAHFHYDLRYLIISDDSAVTISNESHGAKWLEIAELATEKFERSIARMAEKTLENHST